MKHLMTVCFCLSFLCCYSCQKELLEYGQTDLQVEVEKGPEWFHDFPLFLGIKKSNPPQIAVWMEDMEGNYLSTIYVTHKIATQSWTASGGSRRKEALPHWCHARGIVYDDGLYLPTKDRPLTDGISGATPQGSFDLKLCPTDALKQFVVKIELNHSTDFNDYYPKSAREGNPNYSGGKEGSGQPAIVYTANIDLTSGEHSFEALLEGHSSPDGSSGDLDPDTSTLTTALQIVKRITITLP